MALRLPPRTTAGARPTLQHLAAASSPPAPSLSLGTRAARAPGSKESEEPPGKQAEGEEEEEEAGLFFLQLPSRPTAPPPPPPPLPTASAAQLEAERTALMSAYMAQQGFSAEEAAQPFSPFSALTVAAQSGGGGGGGGGGAAASPSARVQPPQQPPAALQLFGVGDEEGAEGAGEGDPDAWTARAVQKARNSGRGHVGEAKPCKPAGPELRVWSATGSSSGGGEAATPGHSGNGSSSSSGSGSVQQQQILAMPHADHLEVLYRDAEPLGQCGGTEAALAGGEAPEEEGEDGGGSGGGSIEGGSTAADWLPLAVDVGATAAAAGDSLGLTINSPWNLMPSGTLKVGHFASLNAGGLREVRGEAAPMRRGHIKSELVTIRRLGAGASATVDLALHVPTLQLVALKHVRIFDVEKRSQFAAELRALYGNILPLIPVRRAPSSEALQLAAARVGADNALVSPLSITGSATFTFLEGMSGAGGTLGASLGGGGLGTSFSGSFSGSLTSPGSDFGSEFGGGGGVGIAAAPLGHVVRMFDAYMSSEGTVSLVLEFCGAGTLEDVMRVGGVRDERCIARLAAHGARGLATLHASKQMHRDIKPGNMLLTRGGEALKLGDLGITRQLEGTAALSTTWVGTMAYMAPERLDIESSSSSSSNSNSSSGGGTLAAAAAASSSSSSSSVASSAAAMHGYGLKSDVWALGMSLLAAVIGREPFAAAQRAGSAVGGFSGGGGGYWELIKAIRDEPPPLHLVEAAFSTAGGGSGTPPSPQLLSFLRDCLTKKPLERPSAEQLLRHPFLLAHARHAQPAAAGEAAARSGAVAPLDMWSCEVGVPLSEARDERVREAFPGGFHVLDKAAQAARTSAVAAVIDAVTSGDKATWGTFTRLFTRYRNKPRRKWMCDLQEAAFNEVAAKRISDLSASLSATAAAAGGLGGGGVSGSGGGLMSPLALPAAAYNSSSLAMGFAPLAGRAATVAGGAPLQPPIAEGAAVLQLLRSPLAPTAQPLPSQAVATGPGAAKAPAALKLSEKDFLARARGIREVPAEGGSVAAAAAVCGGSCCRCGAPPLPPRPPQYIVTCSWTSATLHP